MRSNHYTIEDEYMGIPLTIDGEVTEFTPNEFPMVIINNISFRDRPLEMWTLNDRYIEHLRDRLFQTWCQDRRN